MDQNEEHKNHVEETKQATSVNAVNEDDHADWQDVPEPNNGR